MKVEKSNDLEKKKELWTPTAIERENFDPEDNNNDFFVDLFKHRKVRNFLTWILGKPSDPTTMKVRVNGKFFPAHTEVSIPTDGEGGINDSWRKTTMVKRTGVTDWELIEDRVDMDYKGSVPETTELLLAFLLPPRYTNPSDINTAF